MTAHRGAERLALACMTAGAAGWLWELAALQAPSSPWHLPGMPLAVARFATHAWVTGLAVWALGRDAHVPRWALAAAAAGAALSLGAQATSAATGLLGVQVRDARAGGGYVLAARALGAAALAAAMAGAVLARRRRG
ncbi:MAG: hypothetical protein U0324_13360 [Polyangiales bacterium]